MEWKIKVKTVWKNGSNPRSHTITHEHTIAAPCKGRSGTQLSVYYSRV